MKMKAKEERDVRRKDAKKTGGGPPMPSPSATSQTVCELMGNMYDPLDMEYDDDDDDAAAAVTDPQVNYFDDLCITI